MKGEIASPSVAADDPCYFQIRVQVQAGTLESKLELVRAEGGTLERGLQLSARAASPGSSGENVN